MKNIILIISVIAITFAAFAGSAFVSFNYFSNQAEAMAEPLYFEDNLAEISQEDEYLQPTTTEEIIPIPIPLPEFSRPEEEVIFLAVGDIMLSRAVERLMIQKNDFNFPFLLTADLTNKADITFGNLESPIITGRLIQDGEMVFRADLRSVEGLKFAGFDVLSLANNHTTNFGKKGLENTMEELDKAGIKYAGTQKGAVILEKNKIKIGILAYTFNQSGGLAFMDIDKMKKDIESLELNADWIVVSMHAGSEYNFKPSKWQVEFAHSAIDAGASLVIGHHPHVVQTLEQYKDGYIVYSLGNFVFDQLWSEQTRQGLAVKIIFTADEMESIEFVPIRINKYFQPEAIEKDQAKDFISRLVPGDISQPKFYWDGKEYKETNIWQIFFQPAKFQANTYQAFDLDEDGVNEEAVIVDGVAYVIDDDKVVWRSEPEWKMENVLIGDFTNDGKIEIGFSLYKEGSYGTDLPFWLEENDALISNHLFLYRWNKEATTNESPLKMFWGSSALDEPIKEMILTDLDKDGKNELAVLEQEKDDLNRLSIWQWHEFNFFNQYKSRSGKFFDLSVDLSYIYIREAK